jgi:GT2 family glycosyltransferase
MPAERTAALVLSIIIVNWNTRELLAQSLHSVYDTVGTLDCEVFVVDNASSDGSAAMVRERFPQVRLIENAENVGFARANNQALRQAQGCHALLLNSDTRVLPDALQEMISFLDAHAEAGAVGARLLNADGSLQPSCHPMLTPWREFWRLLFLEPLYRRATYDMSRWNANLPRQVEVIKGACLMLRREALAQVGLLDESYFMYTEEVDLCYRLLRAGWKLYWLPQAQVVHYGEASSRQIAETMYVQLYRSKTQFYRKTGGEPRARLFKRLVFLAYLPRLGFGYVASGFSGFWRTRTQTYRQLLAELHGTLRPNERG